MCALYGSSEEGSREVRGHCWWCSMFDDDRERPGRPPNRQPRRRLPQCMCVRQCDIVSLAGLRLRHTTNYRPAPRSSRQLGLRPPRLCDDDGHLAVGRSPCDRAAAVACSPARPSVGPPRVSARPFCLFAFQLRSIRRRRRERIAFRRRSGSPTSAVAALWRSSLSAGHVATA